MNADGLLAHYERIADTPDAIPRLRPFILDLAVRGKLVPQDANDLMAKNYSDEPSSDDLPSNWRVLNFGKFCDIEGGNQPPKSQFISEPKKGYVRLLQIRDLGERQGQLLWDATGPRQARCPRDRFACSCSSRSSVGAPAYRDHPLFGAGS